MKKPYDGNGDHKNTQLRENIALFAELLKHFFEKGSICSLNKYVLALLQLENIHVNEADQ